MIKVLYKAVAAVAICQEQIKPLGLVPLAEQRQFAKTGVVEATEDSTPGQITGIADADPLRATAGAVAVLALRAGSGTRPAMVKLTQNLANRTVNVGQSDIDTANDVTAVADASAGTTKAAELTFDGGAINNAPMSNAVANGTGQSTAINAALAATKPSYSVQSIINKLEDIYSEAGGDLDALVIVDQDAELITVLEGTAANIEAARQAALAGGGMTEGEFVVDSTPTATSENEFGE